MLRPFIIAATIILGALALSWTVSAQEGADVCTSTDGRRSDNEVWTTQSWSLFNQRNYDGAARNVAACIDNWSAAATQIQTSLGSACPPTGSADARQQAATHRNGVLNDVATNYWILARSKQELGDRAAARFAYQQCADLRCARTWDPRGWFWDPAADCAARMARMN